MTQQQRELENKYKEYAKRYIEKLNQEKYGKDKLNVMIDEIERAIAQNRNISIFINPDGVDENDKEKMATFHILARDLGY